MGIRPYRYYIGVKGVIRNAMVTSSFTFPTVIAPGFESCGQDGGANVVNMEFGR